MATTKLKAFEDAIREKPKFPRALCVGDSWFQYPLAPVDIQKQLERMFRRTHFLNESVAGRESAQVKAILPRLRDALATYEFRALIVSMGGNDVVGGELREFVKTRDETQSIGGLQWGVLPPDVRDHIRLSAFEQALRFIVDDYRRLIDLRDAVAPTCEFVAHTYDYAFPSGEPFKLVGMKAGPWMKPHFDAVGLVDPKRQHGVVQWLIDQFHRTLESIASQTRRMRIVDSRGVLTKVSEWHNEIHPTRAGFKKIAEAKWRPALASLLD